MRKRDTTNEVAFTLMLIAMSAGIGIGLHGLITDSMDRLDGFLLLIGILCAFVLGTQFDTESADA